MVGVDAGLEAPGPDAAGVVVAVLEPEAGVVVDAACLVAPPEPVVALGIETLSPPGTFTDAPPAVPPLVGALDAPVPLDADPVFAAAVCNAASAD